MKTYLSFVSASIGLCLTLGCGDRAEVAELEKLRAQAKQEEQNKELGRKIVEEWNQGNYDFLKAHMPPDFRYYSPSTTTKPIGRDEAFAVVRAFRAAFPDLKWTIVEQLAVGDRVISRNVFTGTHKGPFQGIPATGKKVEFTSLDVVRIRDGQVVEQRDETDTLTLMQQIGMELKPKEPSQ